MHESIAIKPNWLYVTWASLSIAIFFFGKKKQKNNVTLRQRSNLDILKKKM